MKIVHDRVDKYLWAPLDSFVEGAVVRFNSRFNNTFELDDIFIINQVCSTYQPFHGRTSEGKIAVTNLRTGDLSYVHDQREVRSIACHVHIEEDR